MLPHFHIIAKIDVLNLRIKFRPLHEQNSNKANNELSESARSRSRYRNLIWSWPVFKVFIKQWQKLMMKKFIIYFNLKIFSKIVLSIFCPILTKKLTKKLLNRLQFCRRRF